MKLQQGLSCVIVLAGSLLLFSGIENVVWAVTCVPEGPYTPAFCEPAHQVAPKGVPFVEEGPEGCENYFYLWCWPTPDQLCWTQGYGMALHGWCEHYLGESTANTQCYEEYIENTVMLQFHRSECQFFEGVCGCVWVIGEYPPAPMVVCDCVDVL